MEKNKEARPYLPALAIALMTLANASLTWGGDSSLYILTVYIFNIAGIVTFVISTKNPENLFNAKLASFVTFGNVFFLFCILFLSGARFLNPFLVTPMWGLFIAGVGFLVRAKSVQRHQG